MAARVEVWQDHRGQWRWRYVEPTADGRVLELRGNRYFRSRDQAVRTAMSAYPGVPLWEPTTTATAPTRHPTPRTGFAVLRGGLLLATLVALGGLALALLATRRRRRRGQLVTPTAGRSAGS